MIVRSDGLDVLLQPEDVHRTSKVVRILLFNVLSLCLGMYENKAIIKAKRNEVVPGP